jgi:hypothetical protein
MAENTGTLNQSLDRRRDEKAAGHIMQDSVSRLSNIAVDGLEIWQKYFTFGSSVAYWWGDSLLNAAQASVNQMISTVQNRRAA